jgi:hypothetical protein
MVILKSMGKSEESAYHPPGLMQTRASNSGYVSASMWSWAHATLDGCIFRDLALAGQQKRGLGPTSKTWKVLPIKIELRLKT